MTRKNYSAAWTVWPERFGLDNARQLQFRVNLILFALTQDGPITDRVMAVVHWTEIPTPDDNRPQRAEGDVLRQASAQVWFFACGSQEYSLYSRLERL